MANEPPSVPDARRSLDGERLKVRLAALNLTETERLVLIARNGIDGPVLDYREVSRRYGMAPTIVRQLERRLEQSLLD